MALYNVIRTPKSTTRYRLLKPVTAVKLAEHPGSSLRSPTQTLVKIPAASVLEAEGSAAASGLINVFFNGEAFSVFFEDLRENGEVVVTAP